jgi:hypothetical protein
MGCELRHWVLLNLTVFLRDSMVVVIDILGLVSCAEKDYTVAQTNASLANRSLRQTRNALSQD